MRRSILPIAGLLLLCAVAPAQTNGFALKDGDRVVFYGDSITDNGPYTQFIELFVAARYPTLKVSFMNAGVGGDRVTGGWLGPIDQRMTRDLFSRRPTVVTVMLGMNDASYRAFDQGIFDTYAKGYRHMVDRLRKEAPEARAWLIRPSAFDDVTRAPGWEGGYNGVLVRYGDFVQQLATQNGYGVIDLNAPVVSMLERAKAIDPATAAKIIGDRVHPGAGGHFQMMSSVLKAWNASPVVSKTTIDWASGRATAENATLSGWSNGRFRLHERALPTPIDLKNPEIALVAKATDLIESLNQEYLTVNGMPSGTYELRIDGAKVGAFSDQEFAKGINLALLDTPMNKQAWKIADLTWKAIALRYNRWRNLEAALPDAPKAEKANAIRAIEKLEKAIENDRRKAAQPVPHTFEIVRQ
jgi:lysophospholipase L1-like esterase/transcriptional antiterminator Rof (Rho-off)